MATVEQELSIVKMNGIKEVGKKAKRSWCGPGYSTPRKWFLIGWAAVLGYIPCAFIDSHFLTNNGVSFLWYGLIAGLITVIAAYKTKSIIMMIMAMLLIFNIPIIILIIGFAP